MWTDGRYFLQASQQMDNNWTLMKMGMTDTRLVLFSFFQSRHVFGVVIQPVIGRVNKMAFF